MNLNHLKVYQNNNIEPIEEFEFVIIHFMSQPELWNARSDRIEFFFSSSNREYGRSIFQYRLIESNRFQ